MNQDYTKLLGSILKNMALMDHIRPSEIPNIDLYMDQVTSFMNDHLQNSRRFEDHKDDDQQLRKKQAPSSADKKTLFQRAPVCTGVYLLYEGVLFS